MTVGRAGDDGYDFVEVDDDQDGHTKGTNDLTFDLIVSKASRQAGPWTRELFSPALLIKQRSEACHLALVACTPLHMYFVLHDRGENKSGRRRRSEQRTSVRMTAANRTTS